MTPPQLPLWPPPPAAVPCLVCGAVVDPATVPQRHGLPVWPLRCPACGAGGAWFDLLARFRARAG